MNKKRLLLIPLLFFTLQVQPKPTNLIFIEQIYKLYESNLYTRHTEHKRNIFWLENALKLPNIHPSMAIIVTNTWEEYVKYKILLRFHIHFLLTKEYMGWAWQYDKQDVVFYNIEWAEDLKKSFGIAEYLYKQADYYWQETKKWSDLAYSKDIHIGWEQIEDLNWEIENGEFDYEYDTVIKMRLDDLARKQAKIDFYIENSKKEQ